MKKYLLLIFLLTTLSARALIPELSMLELRLNQLADLLRLATEKPTPPRKPKKPPKKEPKKVEIPEVKIRNIMAMGAYLPGLEAMPFATEQQKTEKKAQAKGILNGILAFVEEQEDFSERNKEQIKDAVKRILAIDPLLISTAAIILRQAQVPMRENYTQMGDLYEKSISFIETEFDGIAKRRGKGKRLHKGLRDDIDEALSYPIELEGEIQRARTIIELQPGTKQAQEAQEFIDRIDRLRKRLIDLLKKHKQTLQDEDFDVEFFINAFEGVDRSYCKYNIKEGQSYIPFDEDLENIVVDIEEYRQGEANFTRSMKTYKIQSIINKLKGFLAHATETSFCQKCLVKDIEYLAARIRMHELDINATFETIEEFLQNIYATEKNEAIRQVLEVTLPELKAAIEAKDCPVR